MHLEVTSRVRDVVKLAGITISSKGNDKWLLVLVLSSEAFKVVCSD